MHPMNFRIFELKHTLLKICLDNVFGVMVIWFDKFENVCLKFPRKIAFLFRPFLRKSGILKNTLHEEHMPK